MTPSLTTDARDIVGNIDSFSVTQGISGWALNRAQPLQPQTLCLKIADHEIARTTTAAVREDVDRLEGMATSGVGFYFGPEAFFALCDLPEDVLAAPLQVQVLGHEASLPCAVDVPVAADSLEVITGMARQLSLAGKALHYADLADALDNLENEAQVYAPAHAGAKRSQVGFLETFHRLEKDTYLIVGWTSGKSPRSFPASVVQDRPWPAGIVIATFERSDLPEGGCGFVGIMRTRWTPQKRGEKFTIAYRAGNEEGFLAILNTNNVDVRSRAEIDQLMDRKLEVSPDTEVMQAIRDYARLESGWTPSPKDSTTQFHLDKMVLVPGFGFFARGWLLNGPKQLAALQIRAGDQIARADQSTMQRFARDDLRGGFPWADHEVHQAGFIGAFRGSVTPEDLGPVLVRAVYTDGTSFVRSIDLWRVSVVQDLAGIAGLADFYPQIQAEPFFPALRQALQDMIRADITTSPVGGMPPQLSPAPTLVIEFARARHDVSVVLDQLMDRAKDWPTQGRLLLVSEPQMSRTLLQSWRQALAAAGFDDVHVIRSAGGFGLRRLPLLGATYPMGRFVWVRPGAVPTRDGWARILAHLSDQAEPEAEPEVLGTAAAVRANPDDTDLAALLWHTGAFLDWNRSAPLRFAQDDLAQILATSGTAPVPDMGFVIPRARATQFLARLDSETPVKE